MSDILDDYSANDQEFIINSGIYVLNKAKDYNTIEIDYDNNKNNNEIELLKSKNNKLLNEMNDIQERTIIRKDNEFKEIKEMNKEMINELKRTINKKDEIIEKMCENIDESIKTAVKNKEEDLIKYKSLLEEKNEEIIRIKKLHESNNKGTLLENEVLQKCIEYNNLINNVWKIIDTSKLGHKGDIQFKHRYTDNKFLIDLKNYTSSVQKVEIEKIKKDIMNKDNNVDGGILISTNKISGKMDWDEEVIDGKKVVYISNFKMSDIGMIFRELNRLVDIMSIKIENNNKEEIIKENLESYKKLKKIASDIKEQLNNKKNLHRKLTNGDIEVDIQKKTKKKTNYTELEVGFKRDGRRSKNYCKYINDNGTKIIKYFGSENSLNKWKNDNECNFIE
jgi:hypothetical protein